LNCLDANQVVALRLGRLSVDDARRLDDHVDGCGDCRALLVELARGLSEVTEARARSSSEVEAVDSPRLARGERVGRYEIIDWLGSGGMSVVYRARDPQLEREVALKLLRDRAPERLLREAQAMARLSHPNVVAVYEVGLFGDRIYIAIELVRGGTLASWSRERPRSPREVLRVLRQAGEGLAAAHAAGIVHRDFKPENVLIGTDGRVRVTDFGLARLAADADAAAHTDPDADPEADGAPAREASAEGSLPSVLTLAGTLIGTPAYMAPEQQRREPADERSDQYSFCLTMWEALTGDRVRRRGKPLAGRLRRVLLRGLAEEPSQRHPSLRALLDALPRRSIGRWIAAGAAAAVAGAVALHFGLAELRSSLPDPDCGAGRALIAQTWNDRSKAAIQASFDRTGLSAARSAGPRVRQSLDEYAADWTATHEEACAATHVRREQSLALLDARMSCLERRRHELAALVDVLKAADAAIVRGSVPAALALSPVAACSDARRLSQPAPASQDSTARARLDAIQSELAATLTSLRTGRYAQGVESARRAADRARAAGHGPAEAEALQLLGELYWRGGDIEEAEKTLHRAVAVAEASRADRSRAAALIALVAILGAEGARYAEAFQVVELTRAAIGRLGQDDDLSGSLEGNLASIYFMQGNYTEALAHYRTSLAHMEKAFAPDHPAMGSALDNVGLALSSAGKHEEGLEYERRALELRERVLGPDHPATALSHEHVGGTYQALGRMDDAERHLRQTLEIRVRSLGPEHPDVALAHQSLGFFLYDRRDFEAALDQHRRAMALDEKLLPADHPMLATDRIGVGRTLVALGRPAEGLLDLERGVAAMEAKGVESDITSVGRFGLAQALWTTRGDRARARLLAKRAADELAGRGNQEEAAVVRAWLSARGRAG
jgi:eukaryotic-like serine/threonine-protein kinase